MTFAQLITDYSFYSRIKNIRVIFWWYSAHWSLVPPSVRRWRGCQPADQFQLINGLFIHFIHFYTLYTLLNPLYTAALSGQNTRTGTHPHFLHWHWHCSQHFCRYWSSYFYCLAVTPWQEMWMWTETVSISWQSWKPSVSSLSSTCWYTLHTILPSFITWKRCQWHNNDWKIGSWVKWLVLSVMSLNEPV